MHQLKSKNKINVYLSGDDAKCNFCRNKICTSTRMNINIFNDNLKNIKDREEDT